MKEITAIVQAFEEAQQQNKRAALATVVHVEGSAYRRPGARMLIAEDGKLTGAVSGGCLEGDALRKALLVMAQQKARLVIYDTDDENDAKAGLQLGCNGVIQILIEPINNNDPRHPIQLLKAIINHKQPAMVATIFSQKNREQPQLGTALLYLENKTVISNLSNKILHQKIVSEAARLLPEKKSVDFNIPLANDNLSCFLEYIKPAVSLIIIGAGNDVQPLVEMASILGWEITIIDGRPLYASKIRFPSAAKILIAKPENALDNIRINDQTIFLLMTHNYIYDIAMLQQLLDKPAAYIGALGPKKKLNRMLAELSEKGIVINDDQLAKIYGPSGLDIGSASPEEIALSIITEIQKVLSQKSAVSLREKLRVHE